MCDDCGCRLTPQVGEHRSIEQQLEVVRRGEASWQEVLVKLVTDLSSHAIDEEVDLFPFAMYELDDTQWNAVAEVHSAHSRDEPASIPYPS